MDFYGSTQRKPKPKPKVIISDINNNNNSLIDSNTDTDCYPMPSTTATTTTTESYANIGGPTQTTATLTPTTLKNIEEQFMESAIPPQPRHHPQEARFVPPLVNFSANYANLQMSNANHHLNNDLNNNNSSNNSNSNTSDMEYGSDDYESDASSSQSRSSMQWNAYCDKSNTSANLSSQVSDTNNAYRSTKNKTRGRSGRKPLRNEKLTPEEEKKRQQRRERNKQAAARCRKRRMDHTNQLLMETEGLEEKKHSLLNEIEVLRKQTEELEYILEAHKSNCKMNANKQFHLDVKPVVSNGIVVTTASQSQSKPRPTSLPLPCIYSDHMSDTGISIQTPSAGLFLEALESGTGLTPILNSSQTPSLVTPTVTTACGARLRTSPVLESPKKLVPL